MRNHGAWLMTSDFKTTCMMRKHLLNLRAMGYNGIFLFPSRLRTKAVDNVPTWKPHPQNHMSTVSYIALLRKALMEICKLPADICASYTGHVLRVSGTNFIRQDNKLTEDVNRQLGGWMHLAACRGYQQLDISEQLKIVDLITLD